MSVAAAVRDNVFNVLDHINPVFYDLWLAPQSHIIAKGGRSSFKSSVISMKLVKDFLEDDQGNVVVMRKVAKYMRTSVYEQIQWAIYLMGVQDEFIFRESPMKIIHKRTKTAFYFYGVDDPLKLKSAKISKGYVMALWFEELAEFSGIEDIDIVEDTFLREDVGEGKEVKVYASYNPPRNPYSWINEWVDSKTGDEDYLIHHSDYEHDEKGFLSPQMLKKIEKYKEADYDYWRWMYKGEVIGYGDTIYNMKHFKKLHTLPEDDDILTIFVTTDAGHQQSATTHLALGFTKKRNVILLDTYYYSPANKIEKKAPSELSTEYKEFIDNIRKTYNRPINKYTIDGAEGALRNQVYKDHRLRMNPVAKLKKLAMIDYVQSLLVQKRFSYLETDRNEVFISEHKRYRLDEKTVRSPNPKVIEVDDHTCDAFQYFVMDNLKMLGLVA